MATEEGEHTGEERLSRRASLLRFAGLAVTLGGVEAWKFNESADDADAAAADASGPRAVSSGLVSCVLTPELTEGPFYVPGERLRRDITAGRAGAPLLLSLKVVNVSTCRPIKNAFVDIWHCDAIGAYSGAVANNPGTNFLRGVQKTNAKGVATFKTIYPGFYRGRAVHIHVKVHVRGAVVHTGQLFFPATVTNAVYAKAPYSAHGTRPDTPNSADSIYRNGGRKGMLKLKKRGTGYSGSIVMGVHP